MNWNFAEFFLSGRKSINGCCGFDVFDSETFILQGGRKMTSTRDEKEESLWMPIAARAHALAFNEDHGIVLRVGGSEDSVFAMEMIEGNVENSLHLERIVRSKVNSQRTPMGIS